MSPIRLLDTLRRRSRQYRFDVRAGVKNRALAVALFDLCDAIRDKSPASLTADVERLSRATERFIRIASTAKRRDVDAAHLDQSDAIAAAERRLLEIEVAA